MSGAEGDAEGAGDTFAALMLDRTDDAVVAEMRRVSAEDLPPGDVTVRVDASGVNYKDALAVTGRGKIATRFPMVPGIDLAGTVVSSSGPPFAPGDRVVVCGRGIGESHWGGYAELARLDPEWLIPLPARLDTQRAMIAGTAGYTATLAVMTLERQGLRPGDGEVVVTGASGGVGSFAVALLARYGHSVVAVSGRPEHRDYLMGLGASEVVERRTLAQVPERPLMSARWAGAVDSVGGPTLANLIATMRRHATVAACGVAGGPDVTTTVYPFILRGVNLMGIDSNYAPHAQRREAFERLATVLPPEVYDAILDRVVHLADVPAACAELLDGRVRGRIVVDVAGGERTSARAASSSAQAD